MTTVDVIDAGFDPDRLRRVGESLQADIDSGHYDGGAVAVGRGAGLVSLDVAGWADRAEERPMVEDQLVIPFSVSKQFINVAILGFVERGLIGLAQPVAEVIPEFGQRGKDRIQIWHLLTHTGGVFSGIPPFGPEDLIRYEKWTEYVCGALPETPEPGRQVIYSLLGGHAVLSSILVAADPQKRSLDQILRDEILQPVGMVNTTLGPPEDPSQVAPVVTRYNAPAGIFHEAEVAGIGGLVLAPGSQIPGGGFVTTIGDLWRFADTLRRGGVSADGHRIIAPATLDLVTKNLTGDAPNTMFNYAVSQRHLLPWPAAVGLGFFVRGTAINPGPLPNLGSERTYGGWGSGSSLFWVDPDRDVSFAMVTTGALEDTDHIRRSQKLSDIVLSALVGE
ncbi:serine hydrolase domain-containing protein [Pseudonocardia endophytica]|uniref:CubicO group peptidase (Beta-lactamase class C family) n=1 Tax=Pseudonocardia endophytica TaxID=401976 RepID=A0A4R1HWM3_PSEEN|nr:serine hydrolase domain-containing protein [Pseudonocardia endophytica]TCK26748.1 CubicO group peptidase (beta-lactamase class C family) [Pseudonocardia endophytica]